ncbi:class I adenylate-forming enzyme family protein [Bradyrhizobium sp. LHD-71]|uniref:class I adenylate-forming enzyme family protein n=1 Tax=Bradyrhizobium sp. LHD-71 TaxID=3072141 RepID=UPI00280D5FEF|nr:class I adenylate-forming enzyme family protein [Bradyrhizobium sp. LHD-71]MDQ8728894.1 class I adenylate-forming enzyme family protein [Bradyrhizobium sp. LHD-71]
MQDGNSHFLGRTVEPLANAPSLDDLFRRSVGRKPHAEALIDPFDKVRVTGQEPRRLTYAQADQVVSNIAAHFVEAGLPVGSIVAVQLPNTIEATLTLLAAARAGLVVAPLPQLWRQAELTDALNRIGARCIVGTTWIDSVDHAEIAMNAAAEAFSIRHVCMFGAGVPEGMVALDEVAFGRHPVHALSERDPSRANFISFDTTPEGLRAVPRTQMQIIAGGLAVFLATAVEPGARLMSAVMPSSFAGICASTVTWLLSGGSLTFHHPFDADVLLAQMARERCETLVAPAPLALRLGETGAFAEASSLTQLIGLWRTPEQIASSAVWTGAQRFSDLHVFGEAGLFALPRETDGAAAAVLPASALHRGPSSSAAGEAFVTPQGTLALRGAMVPVAAYAPPRSSRDGLAPRTMPDHVDTGYAARLDRTTGAICITAPPSGVVSVGGYRFLTNDLNDWAQRLPQGGMLTALPDRVSGHRLAGRATDNSRARAALAQLGLNPLMVEAFRDRTSS